MAASLNVSRVYAWIRALCRSNTIKKEQMEETFAQAYPVSPSCLGMRSWVNFPGNVDVANMELHPESELSPLPSSSANANVDEPLPLSSGRFALASDDEIAQLAKVLVPQNTAKMTNWELKNFNEWKTNRNKHNPADPVPDDIFNCSDPVILSSHLSRFVVETRKSTGEHYPPTTLLCGILRHMRSKYPACPGTSMGHLAPFSTSYTHKVLEGRQNMLKLCQVKKRINFGEKALWAQIHLLDCKNAAFLL